MLKSYTLCSGSSGNCIFIQSNNTKVLVDCGMSMRRLDKALHELGSAIDELDAVFVTHEHSDHVCGLPMVSKHHHIPIFITAPCAEHIYTNALNLGKFNEAEALRADIRTIQPFEKYEVGDLVLMPFTTPHDSIDSVGYVVEDENEEKQLGIATDIGHISDKVKNCLIGCKQVIIESNHDPEMLMNGPYPYPLKVRVASECGHLSNPDCAAFLPELINAGCTNFTLFHLSEENNLPDLARKASVESLKACGARENDYILSVADRFEITPL